MRRALSLLILFATVRSQTSNDRALACRRLCDRKLENESTCSSHFSLTINPFTGLDSCAAAPGCEVRKTSICVETRKTELKKRCRGLLRGSDSSDSDLASFPETTKKKKLLGDPDNSDSALFSIPADVVEAIEFDNGARARRALCEENFDDCNDDEDSSKSKKSKSSENSKKSKKSKSKSNKKGKSKNEELCEIVCSVECGETTCFEVCSSPQGRYLVRELDVGEDETEEVCGSFFQCVDGGV